MGRERVGDQSSGGRMSWMHVLRILRSVYGVRSTEDASWRYVQSKHSVAGKEAASRMHVLRIPHSYRVGTEDRIGPGTHQHYDATSAWNRQRSSSSSSHSHSNAVQPGALRRNAT